MSHVYQGCIYLIKNKVKTVQLWQYKIVTVQKFSLLAYLKFNLFLWCKAGLSAVITPVFSVTWCFRNHSNMLILCVRSIYFHPCNLFSYYKTIVLLNLFVKLVIFLWFSMHKKSSKELRNRNLLLNYKCQGVLVSHKSNRSHLNDVCEDILNMCLFFWLFYLMILSVFVLHALYQRSQI